LNWKLFNLFLEIEAMNKFDALKTFQSWPPDWQRLCAEYWIETSEGEDRPAVASAVSNVSQVWCHADQVALAKKLLEPVATLAHESVSTRLAQDKAAKVAANARRRKQSISLPWSVPESEYLLKLANEQWEQCHVVQMFLEKYPGRSADAVRRRVWGIRSGKESGEVKY
jgi:hypothetical protein